MSKQRGREMVFEDLNGFVEAFANRLAEQVTATVIAAVEPAIDKQLKDEKICWSEEEAAKLLNMSIETLARRAKANEIGFSYLISPTKFDEDGRPLNGRRVYLRHHI